MLTWTAVDRLIAETPASPEVKGTLRERLRDLMHNREEDLVSDDDLRFLCRGFPELDLSLSRFS